MPARFLVTGAAGFVGRRLCAELRIQGHAVLGLVRHTTGDLEKFGVEVVRGDLTSPTEWASRLEGVDYVVHCAANASFDGGPAAAAENVLGTEKLLELLTTRCTALRRFVFVSTIGAVDRATGDACSEPLRETSPAHPRSDYGRSKLAAEHRVRESGLPFCIVRPAMVTGGDMRQNSHFAAFARAAQRRALIARFDWPGPFSVIHVDDLVAALILVSTHPDAAGRTFFCAGAPLALGAFFAAVRPARRLPLRWASTCARAIPGLVPFKAKALLLPALTASDAALQQLGWRPRLTANEAVQEVIVRERARYDVASDPGGQTLITGAASGLGEALADRLASQRRQVLLIDRDEAGLQRVRARHPHCRIQVLDLAKEQDVAEFTRSAAWRAHPIRELFACAGIGIRGPVLAHEPARHSQVFSVNVLARLALAHAALPEMIRSHFGRVVFISSSSAFQPLPYMASYAAANAALLALGEAWSVELADSGVHLMQVCPGGMQTNFQATAGVKKNAGERLMPPGEVADAILRGLARQQDTLIVSPRAHAMALLARILPRKTSAALWGRLMSRLR